MLLGNDTEFLVDLTGAWTLCKLPFRYSNLLPDVQNATTHAEIANWEERLRELLPSTEIFRIDDFLVDQWNSRYDYRLLHAPRAVQAFLEWLETQDPLHWAKLPFQSKK
jgi:hypothetical protein